jgi:hypothetical protein
MDFIIRTLSNKYKKHKDKRQYSADMANKSCLDSLQDYTYCFQARNSDTSLTKYCHQEWVYSESSR